MAGSRALFMQTNGPGCEKMDYDFEKRQAQRARDATEKEASQLEANQRLAGDAMRLASDLNAFAGPKGYSVGRNGNRVTAQLGAEHIAIEITAIERYTVKADKGDDPK
jgi:hypothetical protein